jgi:hypothetical protein
MSVFNVSRLGIAVNLPTGATYDILLVTTPEFPVGAVTFEYSKPTSAKITGIQKCAQFFLKALLTTKGTDLLNPAYGTDLPGLVVGSNSTLNSQELVSQITTSVNDAVTQCKALLNDTTNDLASKLDSVTIITITTPTTDGFTLNLRLVTMEGEVGNLSLPAPLLSTPIYNE